MTQTLRRRRLLGFVAGVTLLSVAAAGCSSDEVDPVQERRERVEARLGESFSKDQADCIVKTIDEATIQALDRTTDLAPDSPAMLTYTVAVRTCVGSPAPSPTTTEGTATTTTEG